VFDLKKLGERTITLDCDVLQADGGTRTAAITGAFVAAQDAVNKLLASGKLAPTRSSARWPRSRWASSTARRCSTSNTSRTSACDTDMNVVMTGAGHYVEVQGTAEGAAFTRAEMDELLRPGREGHRRTGGPAAEGLGAREAMRICPRLQQRRQAGRAAGDVRPAGRQLVPQGELGVPEAEEPHRTFVENALAKARNAAQHSGLPAIADDAGLCVDAFGGLPGVDTAYYATQFGYPRATTTT
jgi:hypothetical protein